MSFERRTMNPGKREREARKRHRRGSCWRSAWSADVAPLKLGRKHAGRWMRKTHLAVADIEKLEWLTRKRYRGEQQAVLPE